jgi:hypothetical protein
VNSTAEPRILIIMPAHNEAENLPRVFSELRRYAPELDVVVVDDYSADATATLAAALGARVVSLPCNLGYGGAVQTGFKYAVERGYDVALMMDADGQHDPSGIPALLAPVLAGEADVTIGSRFLGGALYRIGAVRRMGMALFGSIVALCTHKRVTDPTSGFQALNGEVLRFFAKDNYPSDYPDADTLLLLHYAGFRVTEVPVIIRDRLAGVAMHNNWKAIYYVFKMLLAIFIVLLRQRTRSNARRPQVA